MSATTNALDQAEAAAMRSATGGAASVSVGSSDAPLELPECVIEDGLQKYVLIHLPDEGKHLVRGAVSATYHRDAARSTVEQLSGTTYDIVGGGRILLDTENGVAKIYGYSMGFPWRDDVFRHDITADIVKRHYPDFTVTTSDEGY